MDSLPSLPPATTVLSISQRFAAIQKNSPLGAINQINKIYDQAIQNAKSPQAQYKADEYSCLYDRPKASLETPSAQNQLLLKKFQETSGNGANAVTNRVLLNSAEMNEQLPKEPLIQKASGSHRSSKNRRSETNREKPTKSSRRHKSLSPVRSSHEKSSRQSNFFDRHGNPRSANKPKEESYQSYNSSSSRRCSGLLPVPRRKSIQERLGPVPIANRLTFPNTRQNNSSNKVSIFNRIQFPEPHARKSVFQRISSPNGILSQNSKPFKARKSLSATNNNSSNRRKQTRTQENKSSRQSKSLVDQELHKTRRISRLDADLDEYFGSNRHADVEMT